MKAASATFERTTDDQPTRREHIFERLRKGARARARASTRSRSGSRSSGASCTGSSSSRPAARATIKFLRGGYGCGKTFMARLAMLDAQEQGFATSFVVVSDNDLRFHRFDDVYRKVVTELGTAPARAAPWATSSTAGSGGSRSRSSPAGADETATDFDDKVRKRLDEDLASLTGGKAPEDFVRVIQTIFELKQPGEVRTPARSSPGSPGAETSPPSAKSTGGHQGRHHQPRRPRLPARRARDREGRRLQGPAHRHRRGRDDPPDAHATPRHKSLNGIRQIADAAGPLSRACSGSSPARPNSSTPGTGSRGLAAAPRADPLPQARPVR